MVQHGLGRVYGNAGFILRQNPHVVRGPDLAFVGAARLASNPPPEGGFWPVAPDLVAEIISPGDAAEEIKEKVDDYLSAGVRCIWLVFPKQQQVHVVRPGWEIEVLQREAVLEGGDVVPGFRLPLAELWG